MSIIEVSCNARFNQKMEVILMNVGTFFVLYDTQTKSFVQDSQFCRTNDILLADHYFSIEEAEKEKSYYYDEHRQHIKVMKITMSMEEA